MRRARDDDGDEGLVPEHPLAQRSRLDDGVRARLSQFKKGQITNVRVINFMTYKGPVEFSPGPRLNLILGPNGSGKSSFVCAICIGLAGSPELLGRADKVGEFVKNGQNEAEVQITLSSGNPDRPLVVKRRFRPDNSSEWSLNGASTTLKKVKDTVREYEVQLDNLCQFLPQDKVVSFAQMTPSELLENTEKATGNMLLYEQHMKLKELKGGLKGVQKEVGTMRGELTKLEGLNAGIESDVRRIKERDEKLEQVRILKKLLPTLRFNEYQTEYKAVRQQREVAKKELEARVADERKAQEPIKKKEEEAAAAAKLCDKAVKEAARLQARATKAGEAFEDAKTANAKAAQERVRAQKMESGRLQELEKNQLQVRDLQAKRDAVRVPNHSEELQQIRRELERHNGELREREEELREAETLERHHAVRIDSHKAKLARLQDQRAARINMMEREGKPGLAAAAAWIDAQRSSGAFKGDVYGPIACEVNLHSAQEASYLESHCGKALWSMFVTVDERDRKLIMQGCPGKPNVVFRPNANEPIRHPENPGLNDLRRFDILTTLDEVFDAPMAVKNVLNDNARLGSCYVGTSKTDAMADSLFAFARVAVWTPAAQYTHTMSRYDTSNVSTNVRAPRPCRLLGRVENQGEKEELLGLLQSDEAQRRAAQMKVKEMKEAKEAVNKLLTVQTKRRTFLTDEVTKAQQSAKDLEERQKMVQGRIDRCKTKGDIGQQLKKFDQELTRTAESAAHAAAEGARAQVEAAVQTAAAVVQQLMKAEMEAQAKALKEAAKASLERIKQAEREHKDVQAKYEAVKGRLKQLQKEMTAAGVLNPAEYAKLTAMELEDKEVVEVEEAANSRLQDAQSIFCKDEGALKEYRKRCDDIAALKALLAVDEAKLAAALADIQSLEDLWLPEVRRMVVRISQRFTESFKSIGSIGEVQLAEPEDKEDPKYYDHFAAQIMVKFRDGEPLRKLSANYQSGGERSVSTLLYMISLQGIAFSPFRVVDEINQGMDAKNERRIFQEIVLSSSLPSSPQSFMLTPKLLPQLDYGEHTSVITIFNGPQISEVATNWRDSQFFSSAGTVQAAA